MSDRRRPFDRLVGPVLDLTEGVCTVSEADTAALDDPDEQAILIAVQLVHEALHAQTKQHTAQLARFEAFFEASPDPVILLDGQNHVQRWNSAATRLLGWKASDVLESPIEALVPSLRPYLGADPPADPSVTLTHDGQRYTVDVSVARWREGAMWHKAVTLRDRTEFVAQKGQVRQDQKLQAVGQLAAGIAHEINTPIQYVGDNLHFLEHCYSGMLEVVQAAQHEPAPTSRLSQALAQLQVDFVTQEVPPALAQAREGLRHIARIAGAMRDFAHKGRGEPTPCDLPEAIETAVALARGEWRHIAEVKTTFEPDLPPVVGWADELKQVVLNLVVNASHAIEHGPRKPGTIWIRAHTDGVQAVIEVQDNGCGMTPEVAERAFEPFFTTKERGRGSGQGLSIAYGIVVDRHEGEMMLESQVGVGTRFTVRLPFRGPVKVETGG